MHRATSPRQYFIRERGRLDLLGSIPALGLGVFKFAGLFRLARLSRLGRIMRSLRGQRRKELINDFLTHRGEYAGLITVLAAFIVLVVTSILVLTFESHSAEANITSGGDALWWAIVTITTVGYGDFFPVTPAGRITGVFVMFAGVGMIGALAGILASFLVAPPEPAPVEDATKPSSELHEELRAIRAELEGLRKTLAAGREQP
jgi:voltage-gated potassium channel